MSQDFSFAVVPFREDGSAMDLYAELEVEGSDKLKSGVTQLETSGEDEIPSPLGLQLNIHGVCTIQEETDGLFSRLTDGGGCIYVLLEPRREILEKLHHYIPKMGSEFRRKFLEVLLRNAEEALREHGPRAALIIS